MDKINIRITKIKINCYSEWIFVENKNVIYKGWNDREKVLMFLDEDKEIQTLVYSVLNKNNNSISWYVEDYEYDVGDDF